MSGIQKKGFAAFLRPATTPPEPEPASPAPPAALMRSLDTERPPPVVMSAPAAAGEGPQLSVVPAAARPAPVAPPPASAAAPSPAERIRTVTSTGRVRTHSANRQLPGVTYRTSEERWERLKMLSIQERRPIQDIIGEAMEAYMKGRGLPW
jgi:hypothetical protein